MNRPARRAQLMDVRRSACASTAPRAWVSIRRALACVCGGGRTRPDDRALECAPGAGPSQGETWPGEWRGGFGGSRASTRRAMSVSRSTGGSGTGRGVRSRSRVTVSELVSSTHLASRCTKVAAAVPISGCRELDAPARSSATFRSCWSCAATTSRYAPTAIRRTTPRRGGRGRFVHRVGAGHPLETTDRRRRRSPDRPDRDTTEGQAEQRRDLVLPDELLAVGRQAVAVVRRGLRHRRRRSPRRERRHRDHGGSRRARSRTYYRCHGHSHGNGDDTARTPTGGSAPVGAVDRPPLHGPSTCPFPRCEHPSPLCGHVRVVSAQGPEAGGLRPHPVEVTSAGAAVRSCSTAPPQVPSRPMTTPTATSSVGRLRPDRVLRLPKPPRPAGATGRPPNTAARSPWTSPPPGPPRSTTSTELNPPATGSRSLPAGTGFICG